MFNAPLKIEMRNGELSVFIIENYKGIKDFLEQHGYRENIDFLDGSILCMLSGLNPMEQYQIIKDL